MVNHLKRAFDDASRLEETTVEEIMVTNLCGGCVEYIRLDIYVTKKNEEGIKDIS